MLSLNLKFLMLVSRFKLNSTFYRFKFNSIFKAITSAATVLCLSQAANAVEISPYFHSWGGSLMEAKQVGMNSAILAFAITRGDCAFVPDLIDKLPEARSYIAAGGQLLISFGGAEGVYAEIACEDDNQLFTMMEKLMQDSSTRRFDFDIEGRQLQNEEATARRTRVLARLQAKYPDLYVSFSLPGWLQGLNADAMNLLTTTLAAGVRIDMVNVMTQTFGVENLRTMVVPSTVAQASMTTFVAVANQLTTIYRDKTATQLYAMMGMTPMIGKNDDGSVFTLDDARTLANFAKQNNIGMLSYWSFQRDRNQSTSGANNLQTFSGVAQSDFQFHNIFKSADGNVAAALSARSAEPIAKVAASSTCSGSNWVQGKPYEAGSVVTYSDGKLYIAQFANPGYNPVISTYFWSENMC